MKKVFYFLFASILCATSCKKEDTVTKTLGGSALIGNGQVTSWIKTNSKGEPVSLGFEMSPETLDNLPEGLPSMGNNTNFRINLPAEAAQTAFDHLDIGWESHGHGPVGVYDAPHFDFHFYTVSPAAHDNIPPYAVNKTKFDINPPTGAIPASYTKNPSGVPGMGCHWSDANADEFNGKAFTDTFIFGSYDGRVNFWESMIAYSTIKNNPSIFRTIPQPTVYDQTCKFYPTSLRVYKEGKFIVFALEDMVKH
jgi:Domain of unknown function (DUF5602)